MSKTFDDATVEAVWHKGKIIPLRNSNIVRKDVCGATIKRNEYGNRDNICGWEIDHINSDGPDILSNFQPLQWENNIAKSDSGKLKCVVTS